MEHLGAHTPLPGPLSEGNHMADRYAQVSVVLQGLTKAKSLYKHFHLNSGSLHFHTGITKEQAVQIVKDHPLCVEFLPLLHLGVNPQNFCPTTFVKWI